MSSFLVEGGHQLHGSISPQGAKNEALQVVCATLLTSEKVTISNIPDILDVKNLIGLIGNLGVEVNRISSDTYEFQAKDVNVEYVFSPDFRKKLKV